MIFSKIVLTNVFSYHGECTFDLEGVSKEKNIVLISGRNGFGKTSFLNAIKLLFTGVTKELREEVQRQRQPSERQYILGAGDNWWGVINRDANKNNTNCSIKIIWKEEEKTIIAKREWKIVNNNLDDMQLTIQREKDILRNEQAQYFLSDYLPGEYVPFFFYDGEKIQQLAEANIEKTKEHIERLLNIAHVNNLRKALKDAIGRWRKEGALDKTEEFELTKLKNDLSLSDKKLQAKLQEEEEIQYDLNQLNEEKEELQKKLDSSRGFVNQKDEGHIKDEINKYLEERETLFMHIASQLPQDIVLLSNGYLLEKISRELNKQLNKNDNKNSELIALLLEFLPDDLFERPQFPSKRLSEQQKKFYKNKLIKKLQEYVEIDEEQMVDDSLFKLNIPDLQKLYSIIQPYVNSRLLRQERKKRLEEIQRLNTKIDQLENERLNISSLSLDEKRFYDKVKNKLHIVEEKRDQSIFDKGQLDIEKNRLIQNKNDLEKEIIDQEKSLAIQETKRKRMDKAKEYQQFFNHYKDALRIKRREEVELYLNKYFKQLMTSHKLIHHISVTEDFKIQYKDKQGLPIGMGNLSAGMKQLAATALIWALKTCSKKLLPIIVDTPMARIDRGNQENLLKNYYPHASEQVIILPTDSEIDKEKYRLLKPYIYKEYVLNNKEGDKTQPIEQSMYPAIA